MEGSGRIWARVGGVTKNIHFSSSQQNAENGVTGEQEDRVREDWVGGGCGVGWLGEGDLGEAHRWHVCWDVIHIAARDTWYV